MQDIKYRKFSVELARWITRYILELRDEAHWIKKKGHIKKVALHYTTKF